jgi:hypothetical protein
MECCGLVGLTTFGSPVVFFGFGEGLSLTRRLRTRTIERLDELFVFVAVIASGQMRWQRVDGE